MNVDNMTDNAIEVVSEGARLTSNLLLYILTKVADSLEKNDEQVITSKTKDGKQKIEELLKKHKNGIESLDENLTKEQVKEYQKELKRLGVDFSVVKNDRDNYSFFFAGNQASVIEKALRNVLDKKNLELNDQNVKNAKLNLNAEKNKYTDKEIENVEKAFIKTSDQNKPLETKEYKNLTEKERSLFIKISELENIEKEIKEKISSVFKDIKEDVTLKKDQKIESELKEKKEVETSKKNPTNKEGTVKILHEKLGKLNNDELTLFEKRLEYENLATSPVFNERETYRKAEELTEMKKNFTQEQIDKINNLDKEIRDMNNFVEKSQGNKLNANEILKETKKHVAERSKDRSDQKEFSMNNVRKIDNEIKKEERPKEKIKVKEHSL